MIDLNSKYKRLTDFLKNQAPFKPEVALILGSGLGDFAEKIETEVSISTKDIPDYPASTVAGHEGRIHFCKYLNKKLIIFQGRIHFYEGYSITECILPVFIAKNFSCNKILITNAAGGINDTFYPGNFMISTSVNGINIKKELTHLIGISSVEGKNNMLNFPSEKLNKKVKEASAAENIELKEGIYWYTKGPSYETPAEIKMMQRFGGDAVGMSTAHEAIYAGYLGMEVSIISVITNFAAGKSYKKLSHNEVTDTANLVKLKFENLLKKVLEIL